MTDLTHIQSFISAMQEKDLEGMLSHMTDVIVLRTPLMAEPVEGKPAVRQVVGGLLRVVDKFDFQEVMSGPHHVSSFFKVNVGSHELDGMDYWLLDPAGLIQEMTVLWRPLPSIIAVRDMLFGEH